MWDRVEVITMGKLKLVAAVGIEFINNIAVPEILIWNPYHTHMQADLQISPKMTRPEFELPIDITIRTMISF